jgi:hypothetical protein
MTQLQIFNGALAALANDRYLSSTDSTFAEGVHLRREWDAARRMVLAAAEWGWLVEQTPYCDSLDQSTGKTVVPRPDGVLRIIGIVDRDGRALKARAANGMFHVDADGKPVAVRYLPDLDEPETWPFYIADAVIFTLAARVALPFKRDVNLAQALMNESLRAIIRAKSIDASEARASGTAGDKYVRARQ